MIMKKYLSIAAILIGILLPEVSYAALTLTFQGPASTNKKATDISTVVLAKNGQAFAPGEYSYDLPETTALSSAGLASDKPQIIVQCLSNSNNAWKLEIQADNLALSTDASVKIPLQWMPSYAGYWDQNASTWKDTASTLTIAFKPFTGTNQSVYTSTTGDQNHTLHGDTTTGTQIGIKFGASIPSSQLAGKYTTSVSFILSTQ